MCANLNTLSAGGSASDAELLPGGGGASMSRSTDPVLPADCEQALARSDERYGSLREWVCGEEATALTHGELEERLQAEGRELLRQLYEDSLQLRAIREQRLEVVVGSDGIVRPHAERDHERTLQTVFGEVRVGRIAYRARGRQNLHPADGLLNLPEEKPSHGLRRLAAIESTRGSFEGSSEAILRQTGQRLHTRQLRELVCKGAQDFEAFYAQRERTVTDEDDALVLSCDGKGVVMREDALRPQTRKKAQGSEQKLDTRLSRGEKRNRKRIAEVTAVYEVTPAPRTPADILPGTEEQREAASDGPEAKNKWVSASITDDAATAIGRMFEQAKRRDPEHRRPWVALVDGNNHQLDQINKEARKRKAKVTIVVDFVHVMEYLWSAAWSFFSEGDRAAERWMREKALAVLEGDASTVAASIRRKATTLRLDAKQRKGADRCADYLLAKRRYLDYPTALANGWPIATGVIEGACRHLVKDRMDITGARWGLDGAEAVLKLRALISNGDFDEYWRYHQAQERQTLHESRYAQAVIPQPE
jgi:hypothetical protein